MLEIIAVVMTCSAGAPAAIPQEMETLRQWCAAKFEEPREAPAQPVGLVVLANHGDVQCNARGGKPMRIHDKTHTRGLYCHATSRILVRLPGPAKRFSAIVGVDSNEQTHGGGGSVVYSVEVEGKEVFRSGVMREGMAGAPVEVDLHGATEFVLAVGDGGDGISCDQADWVEAKATLTNGEVVWIGGLPVLEQAWETISDEPPFSFTYGGRPSAECLAEWALSREATPLDACRTQRVVRYRDDKTGLELRCVAVEYHDYPTVEWTLHFKNTGTKDTPILADIQALDTGFQSDGTGEFVLHHHTGSPCRREDYQPFATPLPPGAHKRLATSGGRPTNSDLPYFNIEFAGRGAIAVLGWPGQWAAGFQRDGGAGLRVRGGQELTHFSLHPGEEVRSPLAVLQFYRGDYVRSQNIWRRWMIAHNQPKRNGETLTPMVGAVSGNHFPGLKCNQAEEILFIDRYEEEGISYDFWWMDAGWYPCPSWPTTGTWEVDKTRFPGGLRAVTDHARAKGIESIVWFEPERVQPGTWLYEEHPAWLLGPDGGTKLLDLGNPEARQWLTDHIDKILTEEGIDLYRQDFNMDPLSYWRANDTEDRQGITEIKHVEGYLAFWDELRRRHPGMLIDSCASGGRRNDLETLRRAVPLLRSDYIFEALGEQCHAYGISFWMPFHGTGFIDIDPYLVRSLMSPWLTLGCDVRRKELDYALLRDLVAEWREVSQCYLGDYYPITPYSLGKDIWMAVQFDRPEMDMGVVHVFRRADSIYESARLLLRGLDPEAQYSFGKTDGEGQRTMSGKELMEKGLPVMMEERPGAAVIVYKRVR